MVFPTNDPSETTLQAMLSAQANQAVLEARQALQRGDRRAARRYAAQAAALAPQMEDAWLFLAAVASPRASLVYLQRALQINPASQRARMGMHWAIQRLRTSPQPASVLAARRAAPAAALPAPSPVRRRSRTPALALALLLLCAALGLLTWAWQPLSVPALRQARQFAFSLVYSVTPTPLGMGSLNATDLASPTPLASPSPSPSSTPLPTATFTPTQSPTPTATSTLTETPTLPAATDTPALAATATPVPEVASPPAPAFTPTEQASAPNPTPRPTRKPKPQKVAGPQGRPGVVAADERWVDVDLSSQTAYAMQGDQMINSFLVSTGLWPNTTVTGVFRIYVKYRSALMYGPGYYLPNVPYVMYFYKDYGLHGTYWHNNFGHPMSHGCVNLRTDDAGWLFNWASIGTVVSVHP